ncbi:MAG: MarR family transcriptional regulator [Clostridiales bacterium]|nr:MarR family transcriptional regulator [Clostridiales bacterium]
MNTKLADTGLKGPMYILLITLDHFPGSNQDFMAQHIGIDKSGIARAARELEKLGYIRREIDDDNRRQYRMYLTEKGKELLPVIRGHLSEWGRMLTKGLSEHQVLEVIRLMEHMVKNAEQ